jgi:adenylate kinase family enzyme
MQKVINLYGGPGTGKSTTAAALFARCKQEGHNVELVTEFAKEIAWEHQGVPYPDVMKAQELVFAQQHWRLRRLVGKVDYIITDSPLLMNMMYVGYEFELPSLRSMIKEAHAMYDNEEVFLQRVKDYNPNGRWQTEEEAKEKDFEIKIMLNTLYTPHWTFPADENAADKIYTYVMKDWF